MNNNLYVITSFFNPCQFNSRSRLYWDFRRELEAYNNGRSVDDTHIHLLTVEAAFGDHAYEVTGLEVTGLDRTYYSREFEVQLRTNQILWHKERLLNIGRAHLARLVPDYRNVAWIDADVSFANPNWARDTVHKLNHHPVVQPFSEAINLNARNERLWSCPSTFRSFLDGRGFHQEPPIPLSYIYKGHPGLAWAATREALDNLGGLYDVCAAGSGDTVMANCLKGGWDLYLPGRPSEGMKASIKRWAAKCDRHIRSNVGFVPGAVLHHWHGASEDRGYEKRWDILSFHQFVPSEDLEVDEHGLYKWAGNKPRLEDDIRLSLTSRNEDAV